MMRGFMVCTLLALLAAPAMAATGEIALQYNGSSVVDIADLPATGSFQVDIYLESDDPGGMSGFELSLNSTMPVELLPAIIIDNRGVPTWVGNYDYNIWDDSLAGGAQDWPGGPLPQTGLAGDRIGAVWYGDTQPGVNGIAGFVEIAADGITPGTIGFNTAALGDSLGNEILPANLTLTPLVITPEPASALLLLLGLPFLRRRR